MSSFILFFLLSSIFLYTSSHSFNITRILDQHDDFSTFNTLLSQTQLASAVNSRQTITVLAVSNGAISALSGQPTTIIKKILSLHIVLDYYDQKKLQNLQRKSIILTTFFQSSGQARGKQGFLNATVVKNGDVVFGSAVPGSSLNAQLQASVASQPFNISVLQVSSVIMIDVEADAPIASPPAKSPKKAPSPISSPPRTAESPNDDYSDSPSSAPEADTPSGTSTPSNNGVSGINPQPAFAFTIVMSSIWCFMTV